MKESTFIRIFAAEILLTKKTITAMKKTILPALRPLVLTLVFSSISVFSACTSATADNPVTKDDDHARKALLIVLDGWGIGDLPDGQMGNSETGHLNIGAGRVVYQDLVRINRACADNSIMENPEVKSAFGYAKANGKSVHLMGLTSTGGVHSSFGHLLKLIDIAKEYGIGNCYLHCFMDGRDTDPRAGKGFIADLQKYIDEAGVGTIATAIGRYYAMDRDKHWDRIKLAYDLLVNGKGRQVTDMAAGVQSCYDSHTEEQKNTDEFMEPLVNSSVDGRIKEGDVVIFYNFRNDRAKELTIVLTQQDMEEQGMKTIPNLQYYCMTPYDDTFTGVHILFPKEKVQNTLGEYVASKGLKQLHVAETEKYAHVTFFINGGREEPFEGEDRILVASPQVTTYDQKPEMSAYEVKDKVVEALKTNKYDLIVVNIANSYMVGEAGYETIITADHGNAEHALNADDTPNTAHSVNPVPFIYVTGNKAARVQNGALPDVAPSVLHIMGLQQPKEMTGKCLIID